VQVHEYLVTAMILVFILVTSSTLVYLVSDPLRAVSEREQLKVTAQKLLTQILLDAGAPADWGGNASVTADDLRSFGLAEESESTRTAYVLDVDKVLRLNRSNPLHIPIQTANNLLGLGRDFGFALEITPTLRVDVVARNGSNELEVSLRSEYAGLPVSNANVSGRMYYLSLNGSTPMVHDTILVGNETGPDGRCVLNFGDVPSDVKVLILAVDHYGVRVTEVYGLGTLVVPAYLVGDHFFLDGEYSVSPSTSFSEITVSESTYGPYIGRVLSDARSVANGSYREYMLAHVVPSVLAVVTVCEREGVNYLALASRVASLTYSPGAFPPPYVFEYEVERVVMVEGSAYRVKLYIWRLSW